MKKWIDWNNTPMIQPEAPESRPLGKTLGEPTLKKGEVPRKPSDEEIRKAIMPTVSSQPTDEQLFGHLVVTQEQADKAKSDWENIINNWHTNVNRPVEKQDLNKSWGSRGAIHKEILSEEEERIRRIPVDPGLLETD